MKEITVTVIGSGSTYCPELVDGFIKAAEGITYAANTRLFRHAVRGI